jgi:predicted O-methyltransferase YrrM
MAPPGHYYSPLTNHEDAARAARWAAMGESPAGVRFDREEAAQLARTLAPMWSELSTDRRYRRAAMYELADAAVYHSMLRHFRPSRVLEIGSGYSTAVALDTIELHDLDTVVACVEPNPERLNSLLNNKDDITLYRQLVQDVPLSTFDTLAAGDFLFIDSTHVVKAGSDVVWTTLHVLPRLAAGVIVHIHDIFWPMEYKDEWLQKRRDWSEIYLIHAFLSGNPDWRVLLFTDEVWHAQPELVRMHLPAAADQRPGGLWLERVGKSS